MELIGPRSRRARRARRRRRTERLTQALGGAAVLTTAAFAGTEVARIVREARASPEPTLERTVEVARQGYLGGSLSENATLNMLGAFSATWALARGSTHVIRRRGTFGPFRNVRVGQSHMHHFVPGIALAFAAGGAAVVSRRSSLERWLAVPFGAGVALTIDESALLLRLDDVYWSEEGVVSVQIGFAVLALTSALGLALKVLRRGEAAVLPPPDAG
ncbi:MAG: hypothetical protein JWO74_1862 [Solirubrobacterales bacterium]|jgi:hypothetical protein|nr:hypothetical protein [Solirubrobacterales bacterium]